MKRRLSKKTLRLLNLSAMLGIVGGAGVALSTANISTSAMAGSLPNNVKVNQNPGSRGDRGYGSYDDNMWANSGGTKYQVFCNDWHDVGPGGPGFTSGQDANIPYSRISSPRLVSQEKAILYVENYDQSLGRTKQHQIEDMIGWMDSCDTGSGDSGVTPSFLEGNGSGIRGGVPRDIVNNAKTAINKSSSMALPSGTPKITHTQAVSDNGHTVTWTFHLSNCFNPNKAKVKYSTNGVPDGKVSVNGASQSNNNGSDNITPHTNNTGNGTVTVSLHSDSHNIDPGEAGKPDSTTYGFNASVDDQSSPSIEMGYYKADKRTRQNGVFQHITLGKLSNNDSNDSISSSGKHQDKISTAHSTVASSGEVQTQAPQPIDVEITKHAKRSGKPLNNIKFDMIVASGPDEGHVVSSAVTGSDGVATFKDINKDKDIKAGTPLKIKEVSSDNNHTITSHEVNFNMPPTKMVSGQQQKYTKGHTHHEYRVVNGNRNPTAPIKTWHTTTPKSKIPKAPPVSKSALQTEKLGPFAFTDTAISNMPNIRSYAREPDDEGSVTGTQSVDAKNEHLKDTLDIHHLDGGRKYEVVDQLVNPETLKPVKINGDSVQGTQDFTAANKYRDEHPGRQLTFDYTNVNFKTLADHDYIFNAMIYDPNQKDSSHPHGKLLGEEAQPTGDTQEMSDASQRIWVNKIHSHSQAEANNNPDGCGTQRINPYSKTNLKDRVSLTGLVNKHQYTINEKVMVRDGDSVKPLNVDGKDVTASKDFTADGSMDTVNVHLPQFSTANLASRNLVVYYDVTPKDQSSDVLDKSDNPHNCNESIHITNPKLHTTALIDNDKETNPGTKSHLEDKVRYSDVAANQPMTLAAQAADKDGKAVVVPNGSHSSYIMGKLNFTPDGDDGEEDVAMREAGSASGSTPNIKSASTRAQLNNLTPTSGSPSDTDSSKYDINTSALAGKSMVMFEDLYAGGDSTPIASYDSTNDDNETVHLAAPKIVSHALADGYKEANPGTKTHINDRVKYVGAAPGHSLNLSSTVMDPKTQQPITGKDKNGQSFNLMGRKVFTPSEKNGSKKIPIQEVQQGQPAKTSNGDQASTNTANIRNMMPKKMSDSSDVKKLVQAVSSWPDTGDTTAAQVKQAIQGQLSKLDNYVYDGRAGEPKDLTSAISELNNDVDDKSPSSLNLQTMLGDANDFQAAFVNDVDNGSLMTQSQYDNKKSVASQTGASSSASSNSGSKASSAVGSSVVNSGSKLSVSSAGSSSEKDSSAGIARVKANHLSDNGTSDGLGSLPSESGKTSNSSDQYDIDTTGLRGRSMDAYEDMTSPHDDNSTDIASDASPSNSDQTVHISAPQIRTEQTVNDDKSASTGKRDDFTDKVEYTGVAPHQPLALDSVEMQQGTSNPVTIDGRYLIGHRTFKPEKANGDTDVEFETAGDHPLSKWVQKDLTSGGMQSKHSATDSADGVKASKAVKNDEKAGNNSMDDVPSATDAQHASDSKENGGTPADSSAAKKDSSVASSDDIDASKAGSSASSASSVMNSDQDDTASGSDDKGKSAESADDSEASDVSNDNDDEGDGNNTSRNGIDLAPLNHTGASNYKWVAFETAENPADGTVIAEHKNPNDASQSVDLNVPKPKRKKKPHCCPTNIQIYNKGSKARARSQAQSTPGTYGSPSLQTGKGGGQPYNSVPSSHSKFAGPELQFARTSGPSRIHHGILHKVSRWIAAHF